MKKTITVLLLVTVLNILLVGCGGTNTSNAGTTSSQTVQSSETIQVKEEESFLPIEVKEYGYSISGEYLYYSIHLFNPNESTLIEFPSFRISARDESGILLGVEEQTLFAIYPKQDSWYAFMAFKVDKAPDSVEIEVLPPSEYNVKDVSTAVHPEYNQLEVVNSAIRENKIVGEIKNDNSYDINTAVVTVVFRDENGTLIGGTSTFVDSVSAGKTTPFEMSIYEHFKTDIYEIYADNWSL